MNIKNAIESSTSERDKYKYYLSLGYGEKAASVLTLITFGETYPAAFVSLFPQENRLDRIYDWILEYEGEDLEIGMREYVTKRSGDLSDEFKKLIHPSMDGSNRFYSSVAGGGMMGGAMMGGAMMGGAMNMAQAQPMMMSSMRMSAQPAGLAAAAMVSPALQASAAKIDPNLTATDSYEMIEEKDAKSVLTSPTSTFRMTTSTASVGMIVNQLRNGRSVNMSQVRIEEFLNYFDYKKDEAEKGEGLKFKVNTELMDKSADKKLLYINVEADASPKEHQNIVFLLDTSGSMSGKAENTQAIIATVVSKLNEGDALSLVTYSSIDHTIFTNHIVSGKGDREDLMGVFLTVIIEGCTNGSAGIETAYSLGEKTYKDGWSNQVILITDGDLNFGVTEKNGLKDLIEEKKKTGMFLSVIGTGLYNYKDDKLEVLSKHGNGTYCVVNELEDVDESINKRYVSLTNIVAKDVKAQVEFNPKYVKKYRLLGYENRTLNHEDFKNDDVISEPYGAGGQGVALYELYMGDATENPVEELKYQRLATNDYEELGTVSVRFKAPLSDESDEVSGIIPLAPKATDNSRFAYFLYCLSEKLRGSDKLDEDDIKFFDDMLEGGKYKELAGSKADFLEKLVNNRDSIAKNSMNNPLPSGGMPIGMMGGNPMTGFMGMMNMNQVNPMFNQGTPAPATTAQTAPAAPAPQPGEWTCPLCGGVNSGKFCATCGGVRPEQNS